MARDYGSNLPLSESEREAFRELINTLGERAALQRAQLSRMGGYRALAGLPVEPGTRALVRQAVADLHGD